MGTRHEIPAVSGSRGTAIGAAKVLYPTHFEVDDKPIALGDIATEIAHFDEAIDATRSELLALQSRLKGALAKDIAEFIDAHILIIDDVEFSGAIRELVRSKKISAVSALRSQRDTLVAIFDAMEDPYLRSRRDDVDQVAGRVYAALRRSESGESLQRGGKRGHNNIIVCETISPTDLVSAHEHGALGVVMSAGSAYSHATILARSLGLPLVCGAKQALNLIHDGDVVLIDSDAGRVIVNPDSFDLSRFRSHQQDEAAARKRRSRLRNVETQTEDGIGIHLYANAETAADIAQARRAGAAGVGLYRSEFLFMRRRELPSEDEQFRVYREAVLSMAGKPVTFRTLDLGADKTVGGPLEHGVEENPALGLRGLRLSLSKRPVFATQLRALLRASAYGPVRILLPMITSYQEVIQSKAILLECRDDLAAKKIAMAESVELGGMIEVPGAALISAELLTVLDFLAIGTNDLVQYTLAADRNNSHVAEQYDPLHPAVVRLLALVIENAARAGKPVSVCGEMASNPEHVPLLLALGLTELSVHASMILELRELLMGVSRKRLINKAGALLAAVDRKSLSQLAAALKPRAKAQPNSKTK